MCAHNILYTYIEPFTFSSTSNLTIDIVLLIFGIAAGIGILFTAAVVDNYLFATAWVCGLLFLIGLIILALFSDGDLGFLIGLVLWGLGFGGAPTVLQTALALRSNEYADLAQSFFVTIFNIGVALGGGIGGGWLALMGPGHLPWVAAVICLSIFLLIVSNPRVFGMNSSDG